MEKSVGVTARGISSSLSFGLASPLQEHLEEERVTSQGLRHAKLHVRILPGQHSARLGQIPAHVDASGKKIGQENDSLRPLRDARLGSLLDVRLGQLEKGGLDGSVASLVP
jgi:hypothetical protein